jgi:hypothetical protein
MRHRLVALALFMFVASGFGCTQPSDTDPTSVQGRADDGAGLLKQVQRIVPSADLRYNLRNIERQQMLVRHGYGALSLPFTSVVKLRPTFDKYAQLFGLERGPIEAWELKHHSMPTRFGLSDHSFGAAAASRLLGPLQDVRVRRGAGDELSRCSETESGCVAMSEQDLAGLAAEAFMDAAGPTVQSPCPDSGTCKALSAGVLYVLVRALVDEQHESFVLSLSRRDKPGQIEHRLVYGYVVSDLRAKSGPEAAKLLKGDVAQFDASHGWMEVPMNLYLEGQHDELDAFVTVDMLLELSGPPSLPGSTIVAGHYLPTANRRALPIAVTLPLEPAGAAQQRNPNISIEHVRKLAQLSQKPKP